ncbi:hypothetical protein INT45_009854 [Circinella minor]|uniref:ADF-H domain-containing protein n=1 Tax=Circinella minor TaxID=1195481 RepID=A0A8H7VDM9_9FUNG|nr:hypothetical protein INT45_009854 [Circinella minor]
MCDVSDPKIAQAYAAIEQSEDTNWLILGYNDTRDVISLYSKGSGGLSEFRQHLSNEVLYGFVRIDGRFILITWVSEQVRLNIHLIITYIIARALVHSRSVANVLKSHNAQITASSLNDLSDANIRTRLKLNENQVPNRSRPPSMSERKRSSLAARRKSQQTPPPNNSEQVVDEPESFVEASEDFPPSLQQDNGEALKRQQQEGQLLKEAAEEAKKKQEATAAAAAALEKQQQQQKETEAARQHQEQQEQQNQQRKKEEAERKAIEKQQQKEAEKQRKELDQKQLEKAEAAKKQEAEFAAKKQKELEAKKKAEAEAVAQKKVAEAEAKKKAEAEKRRLEEQKAMERRMKEAEKNKDVMLSGFASVQPNTSPFWRRRYFIIRGKNLILYRDELNPKPIHVIDLRTVTRLSPIDQERETFVPNAFVLETQSEGSYQVFAGSKNECMTILTALQTVISS